MHCSPPSPFLVILSGSCWKILFTVKPATHAGPQGRSFGHSEPLPLGQCSCVCVCALAHVCVSVHPLM